MKRIGKVKVFSEEGALIPEGQPRESDLGPKKIFNMFAPAEIVRSGVALIVVVFSAGFLWASLKNGIQTISDRLSELNQSFTQFKQEDGNFHKTIYQKLDDKDKRIDCLSQKTASCCPNNTMQC